MVKVWTTRSQNNTRYGQHATGAQYRCWHSDVARTVNKGEHADNVHVQQTREKALLIDWWRTLGWQKSSTPTTRKSSTKSLVRSSNSGVTLMCMTPSKHTQAKVGCAGLLHAAVCSSGPQCLEPSPCCPHRPSCTSGPSCTSACSDSAWLCAVQTKARVGQGTVCQSALCSGEPLRRAGNTHSPPFLPMLRHFSEDSIITRCRDVIGQEVGVKCGCMQGCCEGASPDVRS